jgi:hypothetical protein
LAGGVAGQREHEGLGAPGSAVVTAKLGVDQTKRGVALAGDGERKRHATAQLGLVAKAHRQHIFLLRARGIARHVEGKAAVGGEFGRGRAERRGPRTAACRLRLTHDGAEATPPLPGALRGVNPSRARASATPGNAHPERLAAIETRRRLRGSSARVAR